MYSINMHAHCMYTRFLPFSRAVHWSLLSWCWWLPIPSPGARIRSVAGLTLGCCQGGYGKPVINHRGVTRNIRDIYVNMFPRWYVHGIWFSNGRVKTYPSCTLQGCHFLRQISNSGIFHGHVWLPEGISIGVSIGFDFFLGGQTQLTGKTFRCGFLDHLLIHPLMILLSLCVHAAQ